ncbi:MAG: hypothetical protein QOG15_1225 [Solirubrobacteraceae bacterium]|jgi:hypothetical protein|nr:hypothetical protein [Solirubrobacteraceae bacterium]
MLRRGLWLALAVLVSCALAQRAEATAPVFSAPQQIGSGLFPKAVMGSNGDAIVAWGGGRGGIFVARRSALGGGFTGPVQVGDDGPPLSIATNARGDIAVAWTTIWGAEVGQARVAIAPAGGAFGPPEDVPVPSRGPVVHTDDEGRQFTPPQVAVAADGTVAVGNLETDRGADVSRTLVSLRPPGGRFGAPQVLSAANVDPGQPWTSEAKLGADGLGRVYAVWGMGAGGRGWLLSAAESAGRPFGSPRLVSDLSRQANSEMDLAVNERGDAIATWSSSDPHPAGEPVPGRVEVAELAESGAWARRPPVTAGDEALGAPRVDINDKGDAIVSWARSGGTATSFRPAGGSFGPATSSAFAVDPRLEVPVALDALGISVAASAADQVSAQIRVRDDRPELPVAVSGAGNGLAYTGIAMDRFGNGVITWTEVAAGRQPGYDEAAVMAAAYSALPPAVDEVRMGKRRLALRSSEAGVARITVRRRHSARKALQSVVLRPGKNAPKLAKGVRKLVRRKGRYTMTVRTYDAGPRHATYKVKFRRR